MGERGIKMDTKIGDRIAVDSGSEKQREAIIVDIRDTNTDAPTYLVEWADNGHRQLVAVGPGVSIERR